MSNVTNRRRFVSRAAATASVLPLLPQASGATVPKSSVYERIGVKPLINGMGTVTAVGGSNMPREVLQAMDDAAQFFVDVPELQRKVGQRIAELLKIPAAMVTAGAASSIAVATAACIARGDRERYAALPNTGGMPNEVILQKSHLSGYESQMTTMGAKLVWVDTQVELEAAIGPRTAMMFYLNKAGGAIGRAEWVRIAKARGIPSLNDAAADVPPVSRLSSIVNEGFDLVAFSGGKAMRGPQCSGLLLGREDLIEAGYPAISPAGGPGRAMKVGKEEIIGLLVAVERFLKLDHEAEFRGFDAKVAEMIKGLAPLPAGVKAERDIPAIANEVPHLKVTWDEKELGKTSRDVVKTLREGTPSIAILGQGPGHILVSVLMLQGAEHTVVARRLREVLA